MQDLKLSIFKNLKSYDSKPVGLQEILWWIQHDESVRNKTELYRKMAYGLSRDEANKKVKESMMPAFSVAVLFNGNGKQTTHVNRVTGLAICDIDHVDKSKVEVMRGQILADPHTLLAYRTISGEGFRVIFRYSEKPVQSVSDYQPPENALSYRAAYRKGNEYFATLCGVDYDGQCGDLTRLSGMAHDPEAYLNTEAMPFIITDDEAAAANLSADTEPGKRRKEYAVGTCHAMSCMQPTCSTVLARPSTRCWNGPHRTGMTTTRRSARVLYSGYGRTDSRNMAHGASPKPDGQKRCR